ncbi:MAG: MFS transporter, partial [Steroidobacteraceae bacterium]|nr:MFS transporter [Steroidobacteraceae bacterium]
MNADATRTVDVTQALDAAPLSPLQISTVALSLLAMIFDGFDIQAVAFAAPEITKAWQIDRAALGPVLAAGLVGMAIGALAFGWWADRVGRRAAMIAAMVLIAAGSLACAFASNLTELTAMRLATGVGLGGALPVATALIAEFAPARWRSLAVAIAVVGIPLGGVTGAAIAQDLVPRLGWPSVFVVGGVLPAALAVVLWFALPESPKYLAQHRSRSTELATLLNRLDPNNRLTGAERFIVPELAVERARVGALFTPALRRSTLALWLLYFTNIFVIYVFFSWLPTVLSAAGLATAVSIRGALWFNLGGVIGSLICAYLIGRFGSRSVLLSIAAGSVVMTFAIGSNGVLTGTGGSVVLLMWSIAGAGACINAVQVGAYALAAHVYPTNVRGTGVGAAG